MARTAIAVQQIPGNGGAIAGIVYSAADSANGMSFPWTGRELVLVKNASGGSINATGVSVADRFGRTGDTVAAVGAGAECVMGPFAAELFRQADGNVYLNFSASASVTVAVVQTPQP